MPVRHAALATLSLLLTTPLVPAQWPATATGTPIGDGVGEQALPKVAATSDGGCYVGWFDNRNGSYAVYLQRYDAAGAEQWPHGGILVSGNPQSTSLVDWDLIADSQDHCVLVFTDTRTGPDLDVFAYRISPAGAFAWGANGVTLSSNSDYEANPRICETGTGLFAVVWPNSPTNTIRHQMLYANGTTIYPMNGYGIAADAGATSPGFARVVAGDANSYIVSWVRTTAFAGTRHVHLQKFAAGGSPVWNGGTRLAVFDLASVPIAHEPRLLADGAGGAIVAWHFAAGNLFSVRVQHVTAGGVEVFAHNGVDPSNSANSKFDPALVWLPATSEVLVAWNERNVAQTTWGLFAQKLDAVGAPAWGPTGVTLLPIDTVVKFAPVAAPLRSSAANDGFAVGVLVESLGLLQKSVQLFGVTNSGSAAFPPVLACSVPSDKLRLAAAATTSGTQILAWGDQRNGNADVYGAAVDARGVLGTTPATTTIGGCGLNPPGSFAVTGRPAIGTAMTWTLHNPLSTQTPGATAAFLFAGTAGLPLPCGVPVPGFGMSAPGAAGEVLVDISQPYVSLFAGVWAAPLPYPFAVPFTPSLVGAVLWVQGLLVDLSPGAPVLFGLTNGARLVVGS
ncbi:MAG: hypothetical protein WAT39_21460 [Planctomycetota bacterium]